MTFAVIDVKFCCSNCVGGAGLIKKVEETVYFYCPLQSCFNTS